MYEAEDDRDEPFPGPVVVRRPIYDAGQKLRDAAPPDEGDTFLKARGIAQDHRARGEADKAAFWTEVAGYLEERTRGPAGFETVILEDGEEWDGLNHKKIKKRVTGAKRPPRSGKAT
jgi:hypothetical protein